MDATGYDKAAGPIRAPGGEKGDFDTARGSVIKYHESGLPVHGRGRFVSIRRRVLTIDDVGATLGLNLRVNTSKPDHLSPTKEAGDGAPGREGLVRFENLNPEGHNCTGQKGTIQ